jgi:PD-(D/E)XK nuclease superfamily protein
MAAYPELWNERGYPPRIQLKSLAGTVVHVALETINKELTWAGCSSVQDASATAVLQRLGGLSQVVSRVIDQLTERLARNPRASRLLDYVVRTLRAQAPELRGRVQMIMSRRQIPRSSDPPTLTGKHHFRGPLGNGIYCEIELRAPQLKWKGKADLLALSLEACEISDFKTGEPSEDHEFQLRTYALLWSRDSELNPMHRLASRLLLSYPSGDKEVPVPSEEELTLLEGQLQARGAVARQFISARPPEARPNAQRCRYCGVRQLCEVYWEPDTQRAFTSQAQGQSFVDVEATVVARHGPSSWDILIEVGIDQTAGMLRTNVDIQFQPGERIRVLDAADVVENSGSNSSRCLTLGLLSEVYTVQVP